MLPAYQVKDKIADDVALRITESNHVISMYKIFTYKFEPNLVRTYAVNG